MPYESHDKNAKSNTESYWADRPCKVGTKQPDHSVAHELMRRQHAYMATVQENGLLEIWRRCHAMHYGLEEYDNAEHTTSAVHFGGDFDERVFAKSNHFRSIVQYLVTTTTAHRPDFAPRAINSEARSMGQVGVARDALEYYMRESGLEDILHSVMERALIYGRSYLWINWDPTLGPEGMPDETMLEEGEDNDASQRAGDLYCKALSPIDVVSDPTRENGDYDWFMIRNPRNRWDLIAQYASGDTETERLLKEELQTSSPTGSDDYIGSFGGRALSVGDDYTDDVDEWHFIHKPTAALPDGRYTIVINSDTVLFDGPLPYDNLNCIPVSPSDLLETGFGYSSVWDLMGLQEMYDSCLSSIMTSVDAFGVSNIVAPEGSELSVEELRDGLNLILYPNGTQPPAPLDLLHIPPEVFQFMDKLKSDMETIQGVNSVARGEPAPNLKSGAALALVQAQALQFNSGLQGAYTKLLEKTGTSIIRILKRYAKVPRLAMVAGESETDALQAFTGDDLRYIDRVVVDSGNALARTTAGKIQMAEWLMDKGMIKRPEQLFQVLATGRLDPVYKADKAQLDLIHQENEILKRGGAEVTEGTNPETGEPTANVEGLPVLFTDHPLLHLQEHAAVAGSLEVRNDPERIEAVLAHCREHVRVWRDTDPGLLEALGYPLPSPQEGGEMEGGEGLDPKQGGALPEDLMPPQPGAPGPGDELAMPGGPQGVLGEGAGNVGTARMPSPAQPPPLPQV